MTLTSGTKLGPYEILSPLGAGGMGEVYRARDTRLGREVAIKVLPEAFASDPDRLRRFEQEARAIAALNHPHICRLHDVGNTGFTDVFNFRLEFESTVDRGPSPSGLAIFTAVEEQLGLRLRSTTGPVEVLVIDRVERPSPN